MNEIMPEFDVDSFLPGRALECPSCGDSWLHQDSVDVFVRSEEDSNTGQHVTVDYKDGVDLATDVGSNDGNPSGRRSGITISFWCEMCDGFDGKEETSDAVLAIAQHKGTEHMFWVGEDDEDE